MARTSIILVFLVTISNVRAEVDLITEPRPGDEYVLVSGGTSRGREFESSHKIPDKHITKLQERNKYYNKQLEKTEHGPIAASLATNLRQNEGIISIEEDKRVYKKDNKKKATEHIEIDIPQSKLEEIKIKEDKIDHENDSTLSVTLENMAATGKLFDDKETITQKPLLTTTPSTPKLNYIQPTFDSISDINSGLLDSSLNLETAGSEHKQHSRIQVKKAPNGQDYEYEYIYYYYDDEEEAMKGKEKTTQSTKAPVHNSHDGPQWEGVDNQIGYAGKSKQRYSIIERTTTLPTPSSSELQNEVSPSSQRNRQRGRNYTPPTDEVDEEAEERLPGSTRFPPRSRNLQNITRTPEATSETPKPVKSQDNLADESIGQTRSRTRANVRRPSSELVDLASFAIGGDKTSHYKDLPSKYSTEEKATTSNDDEEQNVSTLEEAEPTSVYHDTRGGHSIAIKSKGQNSLDDDTKLYESKSTTNSDTTEFTTMTAMEKVALDLYAYLARENLKNEIASDDEYLSFDTPTTEAEDYTTTDDAFTTEVYTTTYKTTTTTTTTTTTPAPTTTTTTTTAAPTRASRFKNRPGVRGKIGSTSTTTELPSESSTKSKSRFQRPAFGRGRTSTVAPSSDLPAEEEKVVKQESTGSNSRPALGRTRFGGRTRPTAAPAVHSTASNAHESSGNHQASDHAIVRPKLRSTFQLRGRPGASTSTTTSAPIAADNDTSSSTSASSSQAPTEASTTATRALGRGRLPAIRPLRPGPRINIGRVSSATGTSSTTETSPTVETSGSETQEENNEQPSETTSSNPLQRLRGRPRLNVAATQKPKATAAATPRRVNHLIRRRPNVAEVTEAPEPTEPQATEVSETSGSTNPAEEKAETVAEPVEPSTEASRALKQPLIARRRLVGNRKPGTIL